MLNSRFLLGCVVSVALVACERAPKTTSPEVTARAQPSETQEPLAAAADARASKPTPDVASAVVASGADVAMNTTSPPPSPAGSGAAVDVVKSMRVQGTTLGALVDAGGLERQMGFLAGEVQRGVWREREQDGGVEVVVEYRHHEVVLEAVWRVAEGGQEAVPHTAFAKMFHEPNAAREYFAEMHARLSAPLDDGSRLGPASLAVVQGSSAPDEDYLGWLFTPASDTLHLQWRGPDGVEHLAFVGEGSALEGASDEAKRALEAFRRRHVDAGAFDTTPSAFHRGAPQPWDERFRVLCDMPELRERCAVFEAVLEREDLVAALSSSVVAEFFAVYEGQMVSTLSRQEACLKQYGVEEKPDSDEADEALSACLAHDVDEALDRCKEPQAGGFPPHCRWLFNPRQVSPNTSSLDVLQEIMTGSTQEERLAQAKALVAHREANGPFTALGEIMAVVPELDGGVLENVLTFDEGTVGLFPVEYVWGTRGVEGRIGFGIDVEKSALIPRGAETSLALESLGWRPGLGDVETVFTRVKTAKAVSPESVRMGEGLDVLFDPSVSEEERSRALAEWREAQAKRRAMREKRKKRRRRGAGQGDDAVTIELAGSEPLDDWEIQDAVYSADNIEDILQCLAAADEGGGPLEVEVTFQIRPRDGVVYGLETTARETRPELDTCLKAVFGDLGFRPAGGTPKKVTFPFTYGG